MRRWLVLLPALAGCTAEDRCVLRDGTDLLLIVDPQSEDTTNQAIFRTITDAVGAVGPVPATICVTPGTYRENVVLPGGVALTGHGMNDTRLRPVDPVAGLSPVAVDQTLLTLQPDADEVVAVSGLDVGGAAICVEIEGAGTSELEDVRFTDCGVGLRAHRSGPVYLTRTPAHGNRRVGLDLRTVDEVVVRGPTELVGNGRPDVLDGELAGDASPLLTGFTRGGALRAREVGALTVQGLRVEGNRYDEAQIVLRGSVGEVRDVYVDLRGIGDGGDEPAFITSGGALVLDRVRVRTQGQGLVLADAAPVDLTLRDVVWTDRVALDDGQPEGGPAVAVDLPAGGSLRVAHTTLWGTGRRAAIRAPDGDATLALEIRNSILWGFGDVLEGPVTGWGFGTTISSEPDLPGLSMLADDPGLDAAHPFFAPAADGPARCAGTTEDLGAPVDIAGAPRPAWANKPPDLGAVESAEPCPGS